MHLITKTVLRAMLLCFAVTFIVMGLAPNAKVFAADVYPSSNGTCSNGDIKLTTNIPQKDGTTYDCATNFNDGDQVAIGTGGTACPFGGAGFVSIYGVQVCIPVTKINFDTGGSHQPKYVKDDCNGTALKAGAAEGSAEHCGILDYLVTAINVLSAIVGVVVVMMIIVGGIQYSAAGDDPQKVQAAKTKITNALLALFVFIFMYAFLQWIVPGGVF